MIQSENKHVSEMYTWSMDGSTRDPIYSFGPDRYQASYGNEMDHFLDAVQGENPVNTLHSTNVGLMFMVYLTSS